MPLPEGWLPSPRVPAGHGHIYTAEYVDGWNAALQRAGFTAEDLASPSKIIAADGRPAGFVTSGGDCARHRRLRPA